MLHGQLQTLIAVLGFENAPAVFAEPERKRVAKGTIIVDEQDGFHFGWAYFFHFEKKKQARGGPFFAGMRGSGFSSGEFQVFGQPFSAGYFIDTLRAKAYELLVPK